MTNIANRVANFATTIFTEINELAQQHHAINLGQGAPDFPAPPHVLQAAQQVMQNHDHQQYAPGWGYPDLHQALANHAERFYNMLVDPNGEVLITNGATEAIFATLYGLINPGDEVILFEPFYDSYYPCTLFAGGVPRYIPLHAPNWGFDPDELRALFNEKTRAIMINTPHNPTGKMFSRQELDLIAELCIEHDVLAITDEVYEHILFENAQHIRMATLPGMKDRTLTISSIGKSFTITGWKIGWVIGNNVLLEGIFRARQFVSFAVAAPLQWASIDILNSPERYFTDLQQMYQGKRDFLFDALQKTSLKPIKPQGSYFIMADTSALGLPDDRATAEYLIKEVGVAAIPPSSFYSEEHRALAKHFIRFSVCKTDDTLQAAATKLQNLT